jgi:uncharacterized protein
MLEGRMSIPSSTMRVGVISDTHGLMRAEALAALAGSELILHAGDIGSPDVLTALRRIAPVHAVRGNNDREGWAHDIPETDVVAIGPHHVYLLHDIADLDIDPAAAGFAAVVYGHSHKPGAERRGKVLFLNPGSAGPRRFNLPIALARVHVSGDALDYEIVHFGEPRAAE